MGGSLEVLMKKLVPLLRVDGAQIVNVPEEFEFDTEDVIIYQRGDALVVEPRKDASPDVSIKAGHD